MIKQKNNPGAKNEIPSKKPKATLRYNPPPKSKSRHPHPPLTAADRSSPANSLRAPRRARLRTSLQNFREPPGGPTPPRARSRKRQIDPAAPPVEAAAARDPPARGGGMHHAWRERASITRSGPTAAAKRGLDSFTRREPREEKSH